MKKLILSLFLSIIGFIGFSSAFKVDLELNCSSSSCWADKEYNYTYYVINSLPVGEYKIINSSVPFSSYSYTVNYQYGSNDKGTGNPLVTTKKFNYLPPVANPYIEFNFNFDRDLGYGEKVNFSLVSSDYQPPVVEGGSSNITPVITGLFSVYGELIPYVVYIGIGILIVTVGFYAIRWLVNWLSDKINNNFKF